MPPKKKAALKSIEKIGVELDKKAESVSETHPQEKVVDLKVSELTKNDKEELTKSETPIVLHTAPTNDKEIEVSKKKV